MYKRLLFVSTFTCVLALASCNTTAPRSESRGRTLSPDREFGQPARLSTDSADSVVPDSLQTQP
jgi:hypothetical protein